MPVVVVLGAAPAPPPITNALAASAADDANVPVAVKASTPPDVPAVSPVPPLATGSVPVTPVVSGKPVALVKTRVVGVPRFGVTRVGEVAKTFTPVPVSSLKAASN